MFTITYFSERYSAQRTLRPESSCSRASCWNVCEAHRSFTNYLTTSEGNNTYTYFSLIAFLLPTKISLATYFSVYFRKRAWLCLNLANIWRVSYLLLHSVVPVQLEAAEVVPPLSVVVLTPVGAFLIPQISQLVLTMVPCKLPRNLFFPSRKIHVVLLIHQLL